MILYSLYDVLVPGLDQYLSHNAGRAHEHPGVKQVTEAVVRSTFFD